MDSTEAFPIRLKLIFYREVGPDYRIPPHTVPVHQWYYVLHGTVRSVVDGIPYDLEPGQSMIVRPGVVRDRVYGGKSPGYMVVEFENLQLTLDPVSHCVLPTPPALREDLLALIGELRDPTRSDATQLIRALVLRLLLGLARIPGDLPAEPLSALNAGYHEDLVARLDRFLSVNFRNPIGRADMARALSRSAVHLSRIYRKVTGITPAARLRQLRVERAADMLLETTLPITTIATEVGFDSFSHFAKVFRQHRGVTPSDYRRTGGKAWHPRISP